MRARPLLALLLLVLSSCGGGAESVPNVVGMRLDVAIDELGDAGIDHEIIGGGTFGVVDESAWTVCQQNPSAGAKSEGPVELIVDRSCGTARVVPA